MVNLEVLEVIGLVAFIVGLVPLFQDLRTRGRSLLPYTTAYLLLLVGGVATVLEGFVLEETLNFVEHFFGVTAASCVFAVAAYLSYRHIEELRELGERFGRAIR